MQVILSHNNLDFDALASMIAAGRLYPDASAVLPSRTTSEVEHFITIYKNVFPFLRPNECPWEEVEEIILVDTSLIDRQLPEYLYRLPVHIYDHHTDQKPPMEHVLTYHCEAVGATITLLSEKLQKEKISVTPLEATVFALGIYSDTDSFTLPGTTPRDLQAGAYFLSQGANLKVVDQFREVPLTQNQQLLFQKLLEESDVHTVHGMEIMTSFLEQDRYTGHLAHITRKLLQISGLDGVIAVVRMGRKIFVTCRAQTENIDFRPIVKKLGGGGHPQAASATLKDKEMEDVRHKIINSLPASVLPALTAKDIMTSPVRVIAPDTPVETASKMLYRYGHSGFPVVDDGTLSGVISRRDIDKALHHGLGHAPVKGFMQHDPFWITEEARLETIRSLMMDEQIGRLPVLRDREMIGIVSRTDVIQAMHGFSLYDRPPVYTTPVRRQVAKTMEHSFPPDLLELLEKVQKKCDELGIKAYLIGGIVRDMFLNIPNEDLDIVVEGDAVDTAEKLVKEYGGRLRSHETFRTATWSHPDGYKIDLTSARTEYYDFPAALPNVEPSTIKEDLYRRDFTVNTLAVSINRETYGELTDYFNGLKDIYAKRLKVLYNLSFVEDPTRILRALRFEARFGFRMEPQTKFLAEENMQLLTSVSYARLSDELSRLFLHSDPRIGAERLIAFSVGGKLFKETAADTLISLRIRRLNKYAELFEKQGNPAPDSIWMGYWLQFLPPKLEAAEELPAFSLNKQDEKTAAIWGQWLRENRLQTWESTGTASLHKSLVHLSPYVILPFAAAFAPKKLMYKITRYLYRRETISDWLTGKDLIQEGYHPGPVFSAILFEAELKKLEDPEITRTELLDHISNLTFDELLPE